MSRRWSKLGVFDINRKRNRLSQIALWIEEFLRNWRQFVPSKWRRLSTRTARRHNWEDSNFRFTAATHWKCLTPIISLYGYYFLAGTTKAKVDFQFFRLLKIFHPPSPPIRKPAITHFPALSLCCEQILYLHFSTIIISFRAIQRDKRLDRRTLNYIYIYIYIGLYVYLYSVQLNIDTQFYLWSLWIKNQSTTLVYTAEVCMSG